MLIGLMIRGTTPTTNLRRELNIYLDDPPDAPPRVYFAIRTAVNDDPAARIWVKTADLRTRRDALLPAGADAGLDGEDPEGHPRTLAVRAAAADPTWLTVGIHVRGDPIPQDEVRVARAVLEHAVNTLLQPADA